MNTIFFHRKKYLVPDGYTVSGKEIIVEGDENAKCSLIDVNGLPVAISPDGKRSFFLVPENQPKITIAQKRKEAGLTQAKLALLTNQNIRNVQRAEAGQIAFSNMTLATALLYAKAFGVNTGDMDQFL